MKTPERLVLAARDLIEKGGYEAATVGAVAAATGLSTGALYRHFSSKAELFAAVFRDVAEREVAALSALDDPEDLAETFARRALRNRRLAWALLAEPVDPLVDVERLALRRRYVALLAGLLEARVAAGELPQQDCTLTAALLIGGLGEALVGPLSPVRARRRAREDDELVAGLRAFTRRAIGAQE